MPTSRSYPENLTTKDEERGGGKIKSLAKIIEELENQEMADAAEVLRAMKKIHAGNDKKVIKAALEKGRIKPEDVSAVKALIGIKT
ncbi:hypothetical protein ON010_g18873 [Phytophthora cinnamomi]|nr:hypothetical protein ON010_g18873 [Phytophthora cinnamomi]